MLKLAFLLCLTYALAKENFRFNGTVAQCFNTSNPLCTLAGGCCSGHGKCTSTGCVCDLAPECGNAPYTGTLCNIAPTASCPSSTCTDPTTCNMDWAWSPYGHLAGADQQRGAPGNLLVRDGAAKFGDGFGSPYLWISSSNLTDDVDKMINLLGLSNSSGTLTSGNMMGLGFLELALKDIVDFEYSCTDNFTLYGNTYPKVKWQNNTGVNSSGTLLPKQFANNASATIDLGPLFDWSHRIVLRPSNITSPYLDLTDALTHWSTLHHMSTEFIVALRFYRSFHYYVARNLEEYFCGQNSTITPISNTCALTQSTKQSVADWVYEQARRSTIRFSHALLQTSVLQILLYNNATDLTGYYEPLFEQFFRHDYPATSMPLGGAQNYASQPSVRKHQEFAGDVTRASLSHHLVSGLDFLISMRNPSTDTANFSLLNGSCASSYRNPTDSTLIKDVISLLHTPLQKFGSTVRSQYKVDLALQLYRAGEIGLAGYQSHVLGLTNQSTTGLGGLTQDYNVFFGAQKETNISRRYQNIASVALAATVPISDAIIVDRVSYYAFDPASQWWTGNNFHPDPQVVVDIDEYAAIDPTATCYGASNGGCTTVSMNAAPVVAGYVTDLDDVDANGIQENPPQTRSNGATFSCPGDDSLNINFPTPGIGLSSTDMAALRTQDAWRLDAEFANTLFYQYDGLTSLAAKQIESIDETGAPGHYLPNPVIDAIPTNIGWNGPWDGLCFTSSWLTPTSIPGYSGCARSDSTGYAVYAPNGQTCGWMWMWP